MDAAMFILSLAAFAVVAGVSFVAWRKNRR
jgi:hypothetical protein